tara:strand:+ start:6900 stop:7655 length:756 start_codon:yes stop_codon:yes gene_type:complete
MINPIVFVGAGPGATDLLTVRALRKIQNAEVLLWTDSLISPEIAELASQSCEKIKTSHLTLEKISSLLISKYKSGKKIVRLHDGDPCLFGAISEQIKILSNENIPVEVVPGISAYQAAAAINKTELTIPGLTQTIILSRAPGRTGTPSNESLEKLASIGSSICLYLSARHVEDAQKSLLKYYPADTPVIVGFRVSWEDGWTQIIELKDMQSFSKEKNLIRTTIYIISPAIRPNSGRSNLYNPEYRHLFRNN